MTNANPLATLLANTNLQDPFQRTQLAQQLAQSGPPPAVPTNAGQAQQVVGQGSPVPEGAGGAPMPQLGALVQPQATPHITPEQVAQLPANAQSLPLPLQIAMARQSPAMRSLTESATPTPTLPNWGGGGHWGRGDPQSYRNFPLGQFVAARR